MNKKDLKVLIVEDDPYARDFMSLLLRRDWRTRVLGEFGSHARTRLQQALLSTPVPADVLIVDTEVPGDEGWPARVAELAQALPHPPVILYTCTAPERRALQHLMELGAGGYVAKGEILYALAAAASQAAQGRFVITPGVLIVAGQLALPEKTLVMDGTHPVASFTPRERELTRLGLLFNLSQRDIADDLVLSTDFVAELMGQVYHKLGVREILEDASLLEEYLQDEKLAARYREILAESAAAGQSNGRKAPWLATLAFHLLTVPETTDFD